MIIGCSKRFRGITAFVLAAVIFAASGAPALRGEEGDGESAICRAALERCILSSLGIDTATFGLTTFVSLMFCLNGLNFCEKYVAPYLRGEIR